jgi:hypothetical protein
MLPENTWCYLDRRGTQHALTLLPLILWTEIACGLESHQL